MSWRSTRTMKIQCRRYRALLPWDLHSSPQAPIFCRGSFPAPFSQSRTFTAIDSNNTIACHTTSPPHSSLRSAHTQRSDIFFQERHNENNREPSKVIARGSCAASGHVHKLGDSGASVFPAATLQASEEDFSVSIWVELLSVSLGFSIRRSVTIRWRVNLDQI